MMLSLNVWGLGNYDKRKYLYNFFRQQRADIIFIPESHVTEDNEKLYQTEWGSRWINSYGTSAARGTSILLNKRIADVAENIEIDADEHGRLVICTTSIENKLILLCNIYGPNVDNPNFYKMVTNKLTGKSGDCVIIGGDFNFGIGP